MPILSPHSDLATRQERLCGQELLNYVDGSPTMTKREQAFGAGYVKTLQDGSLGPNYIAFFEALLDAKNANLDTSEEDAEFDEWYENLSSEKQELYDEMTDRCPELEVNSTEEIESFMSELEDNGITTGEQFTDAHWYSTTSWNAKAEFAEYVTTEINCVDVPSYLVIDWEQTYESNLRYDFFTVDFDDTTFFFHNNF